VDETHPSNKRFLELLDEMRALSTRKQADYGRSADPFANVRASEDFGIPGWIGSVMRMNDKMRRLQTASRKTLRKHYSPNGNIVVTLDNEPLTDSLIDIAVYALISLVLYEEENHV